MNIRTHVISLHQVKGTRTPSSNGKLLLPMKPFGIVAYAFTLFLETAVYVLQVKFDSRLNLI